MSDVPVKKNGDRELPIPTEWRAALKQIADALAAGDFELSSLPQVSQYEDPDFAKINRANIQDYPDSLAPLDASTWDTSIYRWMEEYWEVLVDLSAGATLTSDLVLHVKVRKNGQDFIFQPGLVYVP
ncbi:MAG: hypothetical protein V7651_14865 [Hyphomonas oceanitis]|uniref:DUF7668 domain-containing protein n=1 Tax=Hyphomonas oceanitis SCH89 TaxID=1280953 RepID=A0A059G775_9PROT|nr:hypothetical protein [Hyphomonas oceanitis]KDA02681.1 hypothetical protein HOC_09549 [Hyphomonas oceanitis SCH89]